MNDIIIHYEGSNNYSLSNNNLITLLDGYSMNPPESKTYTVDIPGRNGTLDLSNSLTGGPIYGDRKQTYVFGGLRKNRIEVELLKSVMTSRLQGRILKYSVIISGAQYTYRGRFNIEGFTVTPYVEGLWCEISITITAEPYRIIESVKKEIYQKGWLSVDLSNGPYPIRPKIVNPIEGTKILYNGITRELSVGENALVDLILHEGVNTIYVNLGGYISTTWKYMSNFAYASIEGLQIRDIYIQFSDPTPVYSDEPLLITYERRDI